MGTLKDLLEVRRGRYRAYFNGGELGELAFPPEVKAGYDAVNFMVHASPSRQLEGHRELKAVIRLKLKAVNRAFTLLSGEQPEGELRLLCREFGGKTELIFPQVSILPEWEFSPSFTGEHYVLLTFAASTDANDKLFYFSGT